MKPTVDELLATVYRYYPRGIQHDDPRLEETEEHQRLVAARREAAKDERWHALRRRVAARFPDMFMNQSLHLPTGGMDACYSFSLFMPGTASRHILWFRVSFLTPYYIVYSWRLREDEKRTEILREKALESVSVEVHGIHFSLPASALGADLRADLEEESRRLPPLERQDISFDLSPEEEALAGWIARDIEATFGCERMPPEVGTQRVPDVAVGRRMLGEARLYDCLFSDHEQWVEAEPPEDRKWIRVEASRLPASVLSVASVLAAFFSIFTALEGRRPSASFVRVETDGVLRRDEMLGLLAKTRAEFASAQDSPRAAALRELEALFTAWDGDGDPPDAMVDWATGYLRSLEEQSTASGEGKDQVTNQ